MAASGSRCARGRPIPPAWAGPEARDLDTDLDAVQCWGATAVVSLITDEEFDLLSVRGLPGAVRSRQMEWWHAPIPDGRPPGPEKEAARARILADNQAVENLLEEKGFVMTDQDHRGAQVSRYFQTRPGADDDSR